MSGKKQKLLRKKVREGVLNQGGLPNNLYENIPHRNDTTDDKGSVIRGYTYQRKGNENNLKSLTRKVNKVSKGNRCSNGNKD